MLVSDPHLTDEAATVHANQSGDSEAFTALFRHFYPTIYAYAYRLSLCANDAQDIAQETFIKAARALPRFRPTAPFCHWLHHICTNTARDWQRRHVRRQRLNESLEADAKLEIREPDREFDAVREALAALPHELRETVALVYQENLTHAQAAQILGCAEPTVSWRIFTAKRKLRPLLRHG